MIALNNLNPNLLKAQYAVRGPIVIRAQQLEEQGRKIIYCNIGNPQALKQKPLTYLRQVLSLLENPELLNNATVSGLYPEDVIQKARSILQKHPHGTGAYTQSAGIPFIRQAVADFIQRRDGIPAKRDHLILTDGASKGVQAVILALLKEPTDGFMIPIPQYPLYSATIALYGGSQIGYFLDEANSWQLNEQILSDNLKKAKGEGIHPVALAVINPGNPTGAVLSYDNLVMIVKFAQRNQLTLMADEVYQENVYRPNLKFHSFAKVMQDLGEREVPLFSFHSVSKGYLGECGHRGGYMEMRNLPEEVVAQFVKLQSISLCANVNGQMTTYLMVAPPQEGEASYTLYVKERDGILADLKAKAEILGAGLNQVEGMSVDIPQGAMYAFVKFTLPPDRSADTAKMSQTEKWEYESQRDESYCQSLLEETGICVVPGSGFGQLPGTLHFRTTFLPPREEIEELVVKIRDFHRSYVQKLTS